MHSFAAWNSFVISAYVLASCFTYNYIYVLTKSCFAAFIGGIIYGMSGFMMAHLGHTTIIHGAIWIPLQVLALERLRHGFTAYWLALSSLAITCSVLAHPQIFVYSLGLSIAYAGVLGWSAVVGRWRYYVYCLAALALGLSMAAIQLLPSFELASLSVRSQMSFADFVSYSLPVYQAITLFFPYVFGGEAGSFYNQLYFGAWNQAELTGYVGLLSLTLAFVGCIAYRRQSMAWFWCGVGIVAFILTLGGDSPLAKLMYHVPVYNKFRAPSRHFIEMTLAVSVLSGMGIAALQRQRGKALLLKAMLIMAGLLMICLIAVFGLPHHLHTMAIKSGVQRLELLPWSNPAVGLPLIIFLIASISLFYWTLKSRSYLRQALLICVLIIDLGSFGLFYEWRYTSPSRDLLTLPAGIKPYKEILDATGQRLLPVNGILGSMTELPPNISGLWDIPSISGYGPLMLQRVHDLLSMTTGGWIVADTWPFASDRSLDLLATRYALLSRQGLKARSVIEKQGFTWAAEGLGITLGPGCAGSQPDSFQFSLPHPSRTSIIGIVSALGCSTNISEGAPVVDVAVSDEHGHVVTKRILAGKDTSEWAYDCEDVLPVMRHRRATIFDSFAVRRNSFRDCEGHSYLALIDLGEVKNMKGLEFRWMGTAGAFMMVRLSLLDGQHGNSYPISPIEALLGDAARWRAVDEIGETLVYENLRAMPRVWLVPEVVRLEPRDIVKAIKTSKLPDGRIFDPSQIALIEDQTMLNSDHGSLGSAEIMYITDTMMVVKTTADTPLFLVVSDIYYPGWKVTIDNHIAQIFKTNYLLRGVVVSEGSHIVKFEFQPKFFYLGAGISGSTAFGLLLGLTLWARKVA